jgi:hypothetical protein
MAPEYVPSVVIFDGRIENGELQGSSEYVEPRSPGSLLRLRFGAKSQPEGFIPVGGGVAYLKAEETDFCVVPNLYASPQFLGDERYLWTEGLNIGIRWVMFILILPPGYTLSEMSPAPAGVTLFNENRLDIRILLPVYCCRDRCRARCSSQKCGRVGASARPDRRTPSCPYHRCIAAEERWDTSRRDFFNTDA